MAKGGYFVIAYPPDLQAKGLSMDDIHSSIERSGGAVLAILHDKDVKEDGTPKDAHYHILCMWDKQVMDWETFKKWMIEYCCSSPHSWYDLNGVKHQEKYHQSTAQVHDVEACVRYMLHGGD